MFLKKVFSEFLENILLNIYKNLWFQRNGTPPHFRASNRDLLIKTFEQKRIGCRCSIVQPQYLLHLTPLCISGHKFIRKSFSIFFLFQALKFCNLNSITHIYVNIIKVSLETKGFLFILIDRT